MRLRLQLCYMTTPYIEEGGELIIDVFHARFPTVVTLEQVPEAWSVDDGEPQLHALLLDVLNERNQTLYNDKRLRERARAYDNCIITLTKFQKNATS